MSVEGIRPFDVSTGTNKRGSTEDHESDDVAAARIRQATKRAQCRENHKK
jgi:hypothetical protein